MKSEIETQVFVRHSADCPHKANRYYPKCRCRKWIAFIGQDRRISANTRSWQKALENAKELSNPGEKSKQSPEGRPTVAHAIDRFLRDKEKQNLSSGALSKLETLFRKQLTGWCEQKALVFLDELTPLTKIEDFRASWRDAPLSRKKKQERLSSFFNYCVKHEWLSKNPVHGLSRVLVKQVPTDYFNKEEFARIVDTVPLTYLSGQGCNGNAAGLRQRLLAFILLLRWSGLRIGDAVSLERSHLTPDGKLLLRMAKTGEPVFVLLPADVVKMLLALPNSNPKYFFWTGNGLLKSAVADWQRVLREKLFPLTGLKKRCYPQMFRDTFAIEYLLSGMPLEEVSVLLGHSSIKITEKHYAPWVRARQNKLEDSIRKAWKQSGKVG